MTARQMPTLSRHAQWRARQRGITADEIVNALRSGLRESRGLHVLHYDLRTRIGVVVNWHSLTIITVLHLYKNQYRKLRAKTKANNETPRPVA